MQIQDATPQVKKDVRLRKLGPKPCSLMLIPMLAVEFYRSPHLKTLELLR